jgi:hypothetical protein
MKNPLEVENLSKRKIKSEASRVKRDWRWSFDFRVVIGLTLIATSLISAYVISQSTSKMVTVWSAVNDLAPGEIIEDSDVTTTRVALVDKAEFYLDGNSPITGSYVMRTIKASELVPAFALSPTPIGDLHKVPIALSNLHIPQGVANGSVVDVYGVIRNSSTNFSPTQNQSETRRLLSGVSVDALNLESSKLGGETGLTLLVPAEEVNGFISSFPDYEFILVKAE